MPYVYQYVPGPQQPQGQLEQLRAAQQAPTYIPAPAMTMPGPQQQQGGINWVQGLEGAKSYLVAPGASVLLMDSERQSFYIKSADPAGMPLPLKVYDYQERTIQTVPQMPQAQPQQAAQTATQGQQAPPNYATREELDAVKEQLLQAITAAQTAAQTPTQAGARRPAQNNRKDGEQ